ncbi:MAG: AAA family ATPase [Deltaproteobacteria bacterium]|nr:AAA family ATPase [Deltaproteobacteria bacterium]
MYSRTGPHGKEPLLSNINDQVKSQEIRLVLRRFYSTIKLNIKKLRFFFITGITKFRQLSFIFQNEVDGESLGLVHTVPVVTRDEEARLHAESHSHRLSHRLHLDIPLRR